ncbi:MAG: UbiA family prenyltransferase [Candidatus Brocadiia bacterium]
MRISPYLRLVRPTMLPTAAADAFLGAGCAATVAGTIFSDEGSWLKLVGGIVVCMMLYAIGMAVNDIADEKADRADGRNRPIARGEITSRQAILFAVTLCVLAFGAFHIVPKPERSNTILFGLLALVIAVLYDIVHKKAKGLSPFLMGAARMANVLTGASAMGLTFDGLAESPAIFAIVLGYGLYITAVTFFSLLEDEPRDTGYFIFGYVAAAFSLAVTAPLLRPDETRGYAMVMLSVAGTMIATSLLVFVSTKRRPDLPKFVPVWISLVCLVGGLGFVFLTVGDPKSETIVPGIAMALFFPTIAGIMTYKSKQKVAETAEKGQE